MADSFDSVALVAQQASLGLRPRRCRLAKRISPAPENYGRLLSRGALRLSHTMTRLPLFVLLTLLALLTGCASGPK